MLKYVLHRLSFWEMIAPVIIDIRLWGIRSDFPSLSNPSDKYKRSTFGSIYYFSSEEAIIKIYLFNLDKNLVLLNSIFFFFFPSINCYWSYIIWCSSYPFFVPNTLKMIQVFDGYLPFQSWIRILGIYDSFEKVNKKFNI